MLWTDEKIDEVLQRMTGMEQVLARCAMKLMRVDFQYQNAELEKKLHESEQRAEFYATKLRDAEIRINELEATRQRIAKFWKVD